MDFETIEDLLSRVRNNEHISHKEWFHYLANLSDCNIFARHISKEDKYKIYFLLIEAFPKIQKNYSTYISIIEAIQNSLFVESKEIIDELQRQIEIANKKLKYSGLEKALNWLHDDIFMQTGNTYYISVERFQKAMEL